MEKPRSVMALTDSPKSLRPMRGATLNRDEAIDRQFCETVATIFERGLGSPARSATVRAGAFALEFVFASKTLAETYLQSLLPAQPTVPDIRIAVLRKSDIDLSHLIPLPADQIRTRVTDASLVNWNPDRLPLLYVMDRRRRRGLVWLAQDAAPAWELSRPACALLHALTAETSHIVAHGAAVSLGGRCLLLAGKGRAGKTTAALACARAGWQFAADDYFFADTATGEVLPLYSSARLRADMTEAFADVLAVSNGRSVDDGEDRHELRLGHLLPPTQFGGGGIAAILLPRRQGEVRPRFTSATRAEAFNALFVTSKLGLPGPLDWIAAKLARLVALAPAYHVDTGNDPGAIPDAFADFLSKHRPA
jgi:hypothetical protein